MSGRQKNYQLRRVVGRNVRALRKQKAWSQEMLGEQADLSQVYVSQIETGRTAASLDTLEKLGRAFNLEPDLLLRK